jgi:hypothetical protein
MYFTPAGYRIGLQRIYDTADLQVCSPTRLLAKEDWSKFVRCGVP